MEYKPVKRLGRAPLIDHDGYCQNCGKESAGSYCDKKCKDMADEFERAKQRNGL